MTDLAYHYVRTVGSAVPLCGAVNPAHSTSRWPFVTCEECRRLGGSEAKPSRSPRQLRWRFRKLY